MDCDEALPVKIVIDMSFEPFMDESVSKTFKLHVSAVFSISQLCTITVSTVVMETIKIAIQGSISCQNARQNYSRWETYHGNLDQRKLGKGIWQ